jgi:hypothetical protein
MSVTLDEPTQYTTTLDEAERFALQQLCSTAYLSVSSLDEQACVRLARRGLAYQDEFGYWGVTAAGMGVFEAIERERLAAIGRAPRLSR